MKPLNEKQQKVLTFVKERLNDGIPPSVREICEATGIKSTSTVHAYLKRLEDEGYIDRQASEEKEFRRLEGTPLPKDIDYLNMSGLRIEARQKLDKQRPKSLGQASRIPGVSPGDITVLMIWLKSLGYKPDAED